MTPLPGRFATGRLSPVSSDSLIAPAALRDRAVGRHALARSDEHEVAPPQRAHRDPLGLDRARKLSQPLRLRRHEAPQVSERRAGSMPRLEFEETAGEQQEDEHRDRIEVHLAVAAQRGPARSPRTPPPIPSATGTSMPARPALRSRQAPTEERLRRIDHDRHGEYQARPAHELLDVGVMSPSCRDIDRHRVHHHLHHAEAGHEQAPERGAALALMDPRRRGRDRRGWRGSRCARSAARISLKLASAMRSHRTCARRVA